MQAPALNDNSAASAPAAPSPDNLSIGDKSAIAVGGFGALLLVFHLACTLWLAVKVPVSPQDLNDASWLMSYSVTEYAAHTMRWGMALTCLIMGVAIGVAKGRLTPVITGVVLFLFLHTTGMETAQLRVGVAGGATRIGCYVWESSECRAMLGVPVNNAPSMYLSPAEMERTGETLAPWYQKALVADVSWDTVFFVAPCTTVWAAFHTGELNAKLDAQRAAVAKFRAANHGSIAQQKQVDLSTVWH
ncbi:hypothetical protein F6X40_41695 [Paraburkholderia sp. UCT31]|uniref:hypothetical protein n=1 Tax=Paraburkholderia sp. UCT31 TaxID=2615209 RepID=UPI001655584F|nr:hypothetical protein [Paraburkholderia sp. UCT31]MBC8742969.1 hypothetical protein [Paraburkholderia sp. UCT31]